MTQHATGTVRRLNAAVVINHRDGKDPQGKAVRTPLPPAEIERITALVRQGIGFDPPTGAALKVCEAVFAEARSPNACRPAHALNMLIATPSGFDYTGTDDTSARAGPDSIAVGFTPLPTT